MAQIISRSIFDFAGWIPLGRDALSGLGVGFNKVPKSANVAFFATAIFAKIGGANVALLQAGSSALTGVSWRSSKVPTAKSYSILQPGGLLMGLIAMIVLLQGSASQISCLYDPPDQLNACGERQKTFSHFATSPILASTFALIAGSMVFGIVSDGPFPTCCVRLYPRAYAPREL